MRVHLCPSCRQKVTASATCADCQTLAKLMQPATGALILPLAVFRKLSPEARRTVVAAMERARRG